MSTLVWLVGGPSVGKSSTARAIQAAGGVRDAWVLAGDHHFLRVLPTEQLVRRGATIDERWAGWSVPFDAGRVTGPPHAGERALRLLAGMYAAAAAMVRAGNNVVLEDVVWEQSVARVAHRTLDAVDPFVVRLHCAGTVASARERDRGDRFDGAVAAYAGTPGWTEPAHLDVDTGAVTPDDIAARILEAVAARNAPPGA